MMKRILVVALAALVLSVGGAFGEPPSLATPNDEPGEQTHDLRPLAAADMAAVEGTGPLTDACAAIVVIDGFLVLAMGTLLRDPLGQAIGRFLINNPHAICR